LSRHINYLGRHHPNDWQRCLHDISVENQSHRQSALLCQICDIWDPLFLRLLIHGEPALDEASDGMGIVARSRDLAEPVSGGFAAQDSVADVPGPCCGVD